MASRWFVFWIALFIIAYLKDSDTWIIWLLFAAMSGDSTQDLVRKLTRRAPDAGNVTAQEGSEK